MKGDYLRYWPQILTTTALTVAVVWVLLGALMVESPTVDEPAHDDPQIAVQPVGPSVSGLTPTPEPIAGNVDEKGEGGQKPAIEAGALAKACAPFPTSRTKLEDLPDFPTLTRAKLRGLARTSRKSVVYITALFCQPCKLLSPVVAQMGETLNEGVEIFIVVQEEDRDDVIDKLGVRGFPSVVILEGDRVVDVRSGSEPWSRQAPCVEARNRKVLISFFSSHGLVDPRRGGLE